MPEGRASAGGGGGPPYHFRLVLRGGGLFLPLGASLLPFEPLHDLHMTSRLSMWSLPPAEWGMRWSGSALLGVSPCV